MVTIQTQSKKQQIVEAVAVHLLNEGLQNSSLKAMGESVGISDRMVMYYFDKKDTLVREALLLIAENLTGRLDKAVPGRNVSGAQLVRTLTDLSKSDSTKP
ncbi:MAG: TetR/AcrR family transcriptional regulator, partial [Pseudomonadota bacterium]